jgi:transcription elongation GreA/GreB family factor
MATATHSTSSRSVTAAPARRRRPGRSGASTRRPAAGGTQRRSPEPVWLTADGHAALCDRVEQLRTQVVAQLGHLIGDPDHDRRIDDDYDRALSEVSRLEHLLAESAAIRPPEDREVASLGSLLDIRFADGTVERLRLVHAAEAFLDDERVCVDAPVARALLGKRRGARVTVDAPGGRVSVEVVAVWQPELGGR